MLAIADFLSYGIEIMGSAVQICALEQIKIYYVS